MFHKDIIILKNGVGNTYKYPFSEVRGTIIEQIPNDYIKIQSGGEIFVFQIIQLSVPFC